MKNKIALICLVALSFFSCEEVDKLTEFSMDFNTQVTIPVNPVANVPISISSPDVPTNAQAVFSNRNTRQDLIDEIKLTRMELSIIVPSGNTLDFFESVEVFISATDLPEVAIATKTNIEDGLSNLALDPSGVNIRDYLKKDNFSLRFAIQTDQATTVEHEIEIGMTYFVDAKVLGS